MLWLCMRFSVAPEVLGPLCSRTVHSMGADALHLNTVLHMTQAITALNGRQVGGGKNLVVKYADRVPI